jgi:predicted acyltransferase
MSDGYRSFKRLSSIDQFRGFAILLMVLVNFLAGAKIVPDWIKHAPDIGLTLADLVAPFFIFAIGLTYGISLRRRWQSQGWKKTLAHFLRRWLALIGIGFILTAGEIALISPGMTNWGVLQAIGVAGLIALPFLLLSRWYWRALGGVALLAIYQFLLDHFWLANILGSPHGGFYGSLGWAGMMILSAALADLFFARQPQVLVDSFLSVSQQREKTVPRSTKIPFWGAVLTVLWIGILLGLIVPISKNRVSISYVLVSLGVSGLFFLLFHYFADRHGLDLTFLTIWGQNPLLLYVIHLVLLGFVALVPNPFWNTDAPWWLVLIQGAVLITALSLIGAWLNRRGLKFTL